MNAARPIHYRIHIRPELRELRFSGATEIVVEALAPVTELVFNALGLALWDCRVEADGESVSCPFRVDPAKEEVTIFLPRTMEGLVKLMVTYAGEIATGLAGFYRSKYVSEGKEKVLVVTQFEESDARRAFPCLDHPRAKATFEVEMVIDESLVAISNTPVLKEVDQGNGKKLVTFQQTPKMSSYLLFFGVGAFEFLEDPGEVIVRIATMPGMSKFARFGLAFARKSLQFCEDYCGIPYPLPKLDLIAVPDFAAGAMENWGAITFRENLLLHYPGITSREGEERICEVVAHEIIHQWFGNLVSPADWKYLWLNESFATFFSYKVVDHYHPEWEVGDQFLHTQTDPALRRDALIETFPIEIPGGAHVVINVSTAPIIYNKGGSVLRQVEGFIGMVVFQEGLRRYLKKHEYACASSNNLWEALEEVSDKPVTALMKSWVEQPGFPVIEARREGERLVISQRRFSYLPNESDQRWLVPAAIRVFYPNGVSRDTSLLLEDDRAAITIGADAIAYKVNYGQTGFYRVAYHDLDNIKHLGARVVSKELPSVDRWGIQNDLYATVGCARASMNEYLAFLAFYAEEDAYLPLAGIAGNLFHAHLIMDGPVKDDLMSLGRSLFERALATIRFDPQPEESHLLSILRDQLIFHSVVYGSRDAAAFARDAFTSLAKGGLVHQDIMRSVMHAGAWYGGDDTLQWFIKRLRSTESEYERMNILAAIGSFRDPSVIEKVERYILEEVPDKNKFVPIASLAANPYAIPYLWPWFESNVELFERFHPLHFERVIAAIVPVCGLEREEQVKLFLEDFVARGTRARDAIRLSLEKLEIHLRVRRS